MAMDVLVRMVKYIAASLLIQTIKIVFNIKCIIRLVGFVTYSDVCWFDRNNLFATKIFDTETCSPYMYAVTEWISYEDERSISCKTKYVKDNGFGGVMIFSLNTDDYSSYCDYGQNKGDIDSSQFPLTRKISSILF